MVPNVLRVMSRAGWLVLVLSLVAVAHAVVAEAAKAHIVAWG